MMRLAHVALLSMLIACDASTPRRGEPPTPEQPPAAVDERVVFLRRAGDRVEVVARGVEEIHGIAFRLKWDPATLSLGNAHASEAWSGHVLVVGKETAPGELAGVWSERGPAPGIHATGETVLGWLEISSSADQAVPAFVAERSKVVDAKGKRVDLRFRNPN